MSAGNTPVLSSALDLWHQLNPCLQKVLSGHALCLFQLGKLRSKLVWNFQLQEFLDCAQRILLPLLFLTEGKLLFFGSQNLEDTEDCSQTSWYSNRDVTPFNVLPQEFTLLVAWLKILCEAFCNSPVTVPSFPWDWWQISASWAFLTAWPGSTHLLIAGKLKSFYLGSSWSMAYWGSVSSEDRGYLYSVK